MYILIPRILLAFVHQRHLPMLFLNLLMFVCADHEHELCALLPRNILLLPIRFNLNSREDECSGRDPPSSPNLTEWEAFEMKKVKFGWSFTPNVLHSQGFREKKKTTFFYFTLPWFGFLSFQSQDTVFIWVFWNQWLQTISMKLVFLS